MAPYDAPIDMEDAIHAVRPPPGRMTEAAFVAWCDEDVKAEWDNGDVIMTSPASDAHVRLDGWLLTILTAFVEHNDLGAVRGSELMVRLGEQRTRRVPDLLFVAAQRLDILRPTHVEGAPDFIVEIVSPESASRDWRVKYLEYEAAGVREYWIFDPTAKCFEAYALASGRFERIAECEGMVRSVVLPGMYLRSQWFSGPALPKVLDVLREWRVIA